MITSPTRSYHALGGNGSGRGSATFQGHCVIIRVASKNTISVKPLHRIHVNPMTIGPSGPLWACPARPHRSDGAGPDARKSSAGKHPARGFTWARQVCNRVFLSPPMKLTDINYRKIAARGCALVIGIRFSLHLQNGTSLCHFE